MSFEIMSVFSSLIQKQAVDQIEKCNDFTFGFGLTLSRQDAIELVETRAFSLKSYGRIEFGGGVIDKIIKEFCDSPYISMHNYVKILHELIELFYFYKNETLDKSLSDPGYAVKELKTVMISELYERGRKLVNTRFQLAKRIYNMAQKNKLDTLNHSYNSTLSENGIGVFFKSYNLEYEAHDSPASIDYQLCNPVNDLAGVEFIQKYLENLYLENEFCMNFAAENIHHLLYGYDKGYTELLINTFEQVLTTALGCSLANRNIRELNITGEDIQRLNEKLLKYDNHTLMLNIHKATKDIFEELNITNLSLQKYIEKSLSNIAINIENALKLNTLSKVFTTSVNPDLEPKIHFKSSVKMDDEEYRRLIEELLRCRFSSDKLELIKGKVKSFDDLEDILLDAQLKEEEFISLFNTLRDVEVAAMVKRHSFELDIQAVDLSEEEQAVRLFLKNYIKQIPTNRQGQILQIVKHIIGD